jgi:hypothetical protein
VRWRRAGGERYEYIYAKGFQPACTQRKTREGHSFRHGAVSFFEKLGTGETCNGDLCFSNAYRQGEHVTSLRPFFEKDQ